MKIQSIIPSVPEIAREAVIVMAGALLAVIIVRQMPASWQSWFNLNGSSQL